MNPGVTARLLLATLLLAAMPGAVAAAGPNALRRIDIREEPQETIIAIEGSKTPTFTVFKLDDPPRLFVDIANTDVAAVNRTLEVDNGVIGQVGVLSFRSGETPIGRVIVGLRQSAAYDVRTRGNTVEVVVDGAGRTPRGPSLARAKSEFDRLQRSLAEQQSALEELRAAREQEEKLSREARAARLEEENLRASVEQARQRAEQLKAEAEMTHASLLERSELIARSEAKAEKRRRLLDEATKREEEKIAALAAERERMEDAARAASEKARLEAERKEALAESVRLERERAEAFRNARRVEEERTELLRATRAREEKILADLAVAREREEAEIRKSEETGREIESLRAQMREAQNDAEAARLEAEADRREALMLRDRLEAEAERGRLERASVEATRRRVEEEREKLQSSRAEMEALQAKAKAHEEAAARALQAALQREAAARKLSELEAARDEARALAEQRAKQERAARETAEQLANQEHRLQELSTKADSERARLAELEHARIDHEERLAQVRDALTDQERVLTELVRTKAEKRTAAEEMERSLQTQQSEVERLQQRIAAERSGLAEVVAERRREEERVAELRAQLDNLRQSRAETESPEVLALQEELDEHKAELRQMQSRYEDAVAKARELAGERQRSQDGAEALRNEEARLSQLANELARKEEEIRAIHGTLAEAGGHDEETEALRDQLRQSETRLTELVETYDVPGAADDDPSVRLQQFLEEQARTIAELRSRQTAAGESAGGSARAAGGQAQRETAVAKIRDVSFRESDSRASIVIDLEGTPRHEIVRPERDRYVLLLHRTDIPRALERRLDTAEFEGPVVNVSSFSDPHDKEMVRVEVELREDAHHTLQLADGRLVWHFGSEETDERAMRLAESRQPPRIEGRETGSDQSRSSQGYGYHAERVGASGQAASGDRQGARSGTLSRTTGDGRPARLHSTRTSRPRRFTGRRINLTIKDAEIGDVLTFLAREGRVNIIASEEVRGTVSFHLEDIPWDLALDMILRAKGLDYVREHGVYRVAPAEAIKREFEAELEKRKQLTEMKQLIVKLISINYAKADEMSDRVQDILSDKGSVGVDARTNTLIVKDIEDHVLAAEELVRRLDTQTPQVLIEARIVEATANYSQEVGIQWGGNYAMSPVFGNQTGLAFPSIVGVAGGADDAGSPTSGVMAGDRPNFAVNLPAAVGAGAGGALGITLGSIGGAGNLSLRLSAAEEQGTVKIISSPKISTLNNKEAVIQQGVSIPISVVSAQGVNTQFFNADLQLRVLPHVTPDGNIALKINITKNEPDFGQTAAAGTPTIQKKEAHTELLLRDGDTTVIGGIYTRNTSESFKEVPLFARIPILGWLFRSRTKVDRRSELLIFVTPRIVNREAAVIGG